MLSFATCYAGLRSWLPWRRRVNDSRRVDEADSSVKIPTAGKEDLSTAVGAYGDLSSAEHASVSRSLSEDVITECVEGYGLIPKYGPAETDGASAQSGKNEGKIEQTIFSRNF